MERNKQRNETTDHISASVHKLLVSFFFACIYMYIEIHVHVGKKRSQPGWRIPVGRRTKNSCRDRNCVVKIWVDPFLIFFCTLSVFRKHFLMFCTASWPLPKPSVQQPAAWWAPSWCSQLTTRRSQHLSTHSDGLHIYPSQFTMHVIFFVMHWLSFNTNSPSTSPEPQ